MKKGLIIVLGVLSLIPLYFGIVGVVLGAARWLPPEAVTAAIDNQYRYLSAFYLSLAMLIWWIMADVERRGTVLRILVLAIFLGGLARAYSWMQLGTPPSPNIAGMWLELGAPILALWQARVAKTAG